MPAKTGQKSIELMLILHGCRDGIFAYVRLHVHVDASWCQVSALGSVPQESPTSDFQAGFLIDLEFSK